MSQSIAFYFILVVLQSSREEKVNSRPLFLQVREFLDACDMERPLTVRANNLKTRRGELAKRLINRGVNCEPIGDWTKVGLTVFESKIPIGKDEGASSTSKRTAFLQEQRRNTSPVTTCFKAPAVFCL